MTTDVPYLDGATLYKTVNLNKTFKTDEMIAIFTPIRGYDIQPVVCSIEKTSGSKVNVIIRAIANTGTNFSQDTIWYGDLLVAGKKV